jgi:outer membrane murein-binding lipoprotein Lpp
MAKVPQNGNGAPKNGTLQRYLTYAGAAIAVLTFIFTILWRSFALTAAVDAQGGINNGINTRLAALEAKVATIEGDTKVLIGDARAAAQRASDTDRRLDALETKHAELQLAAVKIQRDLNEVETQFCASDNVRNLTHATDMRLMATVFEKVFGQPLPIGNAFYPRVCNRAP